jgi:EAL domain-containing protein (putative c-di-GMP-specific phosphodiesterase class I)
MLEQELRRAIGTDQIFVEYQPVVDLNSGQLISFEALARWRHPQLGLIPPGRFVPIAEKNGLVVPLGEHVVMLCSWTARILPHWYAIPPLASTSVPACWRSK